MIVVRRRLVIHLGAPKTGSTSVHHFLRRNQDALAGDLVLRIPAPGTAMQRLGQAAIAFSLSPGDDSRATLQAAFRAVLADLPDDDRPVLISHENLSGAMPGNGGETGLFPALPAIVTALEEALPKGWRADYVLTTRRRKDWLPSVWAQAVRSDGYAGTWPEFAALTDDLPGWGELMRRLRKVVPDKRLHHLPLEKTPDAARPAAPLLALAGLSVDRIGALAPEPARRMARLPDAATEFIRRLNQRDLNPRARWLVSELVAQNPSLFNADYRPEGTL